MTTNPEDLYKDRQQVGKTAARIAPEIERFVQRLLSLSSDKCPKESALDFSAEIIGCHHPLTDQHVAHINRVVVGHLMLRHNQLAYFSQRLGPAFSTKERRDYERSLHVLANLVRGTANTSRPPLKPQLVFALAILHDVGKTRLLEDSGHEERAGELVEQVLERLQRPLSLAASDVLLGRKLVENHTMLGTLVQGERSAHEVYHWLQNHIRPPLSHKAYLAYLLLLNGMDVAGYRHTPIILTPYWLDRYVELSSISKLEKYADAGFAERRLCELARDKLTDVGDEPRKAAFHSQVRQELQGLSSGVKTALDTMWIRDALYFIMRVNERGITEAR